MIVSDIIKDLQWVFADQTILLVQPRLVRRYDGNGGRFYYTVEGNQVNFYPSTTTFTKRVLPASPQLVDWYKKNGENSDVLSAQAADFGTLMHISFADFFLHGFDFATSLQRVISYLEGCGHPKRLASEWHNRLNKAVASHAVWCKEFSIEPIAIEMQLCSDELGIAGTLDLMHYATIKGERKLCQTDYKSGGIYDDHALQLVINKLIFEENFPHLEVEELFNWSPKDYRKEPTFEWKRQTDNPYTPYVIDAFLTVYKAQYPNDFANKKVRVFDGNITVDSDLSEHTGQIDISQYLLQNLLQ